MPPKNLNTIWRTPKYLPYIQPPLTDKIIAAAEKKIGYKLPKEYLDLLKIQNGGYIRFTLKDTLHDQINGIGPYYPSITEFEWLSEYNDLSFEINGLFPFDGDGHWNICLDYRKNQNEPVVTYIDTESDYEQSVAATFRDYLKLLELDTESKFVIETSAGIETVVQQISKVVNIEFGEPDTYAYGYPVYRSSYKDSWIWVSPNLVPTGFVRKEDERYEELKPQMETMALRYPEISESALFIGVSEENVQMELFAKLSANGVAISPLADII